jgi:hypothetical protein
MELVQVHCMEPFGLDEVRAALVDAVPVGGLHHRGRMEVELAADWSPAQVWPGAIERRCWSASFRMLRGDWITAAAEGRLARARFGERAPVNPAELVARRVGGGLVVVFSDAARLCYVGVYRERRMRWSLLLQDGVRLVRALGEDVQVHAPPPRHLPEGDRLGVLDAGLRQWLREPIGAEDAHDRLLLPETLEARFLDVPRHLVCEDGAWTPGPPLASARRLA